MSGAITTRRPQPCETGSLRHIWNTVFGDDGESSFFDYYFDPDMCVAAIAGGIPVAAGYLLPAGGIASGGALAPCAMIYGVATLPEYRSLGCGAAIVRDLLSIGRDAGFAAAALCPSNDSLFGFYSSRSAFREWFYVAERKYDGLPVSVNRVSPAEVPPLSYGRIRESLLMGIPHIVADERALRYQSVLCHEFGGGLFRIDTQSGVSCAVVEKGRSGALLVKELLAPCGSETDALYSLASAFPSKGYVVRTPVRSNKPNPTDHDPKPAGSDVQAHEKMSGCHHLYGDDASSTVRRFGMVSAPDDLLCTQNATGFAPWFGLAFD